MKISSSFLFGAFTFLTVILALGAGSRLIESPAVARMRKMDEARAQDLQTLSQAIENYRTKHEQFPDTLAAIGQAGGWPQVQHLADGEGRPYEFRVIADASYELCATFDIASDDTRDNYIAHNWRHGTGRQCFNRDVVPRLKPAPEPKAGFVSP